MIARKCDRIRSGTPAGAALLWLAVMSVFFLGSCGRSQPGPDGNPPAEPAASGPAAAPGPVSDDPIPDLPDYPASKRIGYTSTGANRIIKAELTTADSFDEVIKFYGNAQRENGWKLLNIESSSASVDETRMVFALSKGATTARIEINQKSKGNVTITLERKGEGG